MSAYAPLLPRTADLRGVDRALVRVGLYLTQAGRHRAAARAERLSRRAALAAQQREREAYQDSVVDRQRDNAAQVHPLGLR